MIEFIIINRAISVYIPDLIFAKDSDLLIQFIEKSQFDLFHNLQRIIQKKKMLSPLFTHLLTFKLLQTCMNFLQLLNTK